MRDINWENIDMFHEKQHGVITKTELRKIYSEILSHPLNYLLANNYLKKFTIYSIFPFFIILIIFNNIITELNINKYIELIFVLLMIWIWFNKNTVYVFIKILMLLYAILPFTNLYYHTTRQLIHYKFIKILLGISFFFISAQISYQVIFTVNKGVHG